MKPCFRVFLTFLVAVVLFCPVAARTDTAIPANMPRMVDDADAIIKVECTSIAPGTAGQFKVINYNFQVLETAKGNVGDTFTVPQWPMKGAPTYERGKIYWLFLGRPNARGMRPTIGFDQGVFTVIERGGKIQVVNGRNNVDLFGGAKTKGLSKAMSVGGVSSDTSGPIDEDSFKKMIDALK